MTAWPSGPFRGIVKRPYDQGKLEDVDWVDVRPQYIWFKDLWLTQHHLNIAALVGRGGFSMDPFPRVVRFQNKLYLEDGHHRIVMQAVQKETGMNVRVTTLESKR